jgi:hypothetical protein
MVLPRPSFPDAVTLLVSATEGAALGVTRAAKPMVSVPPPAIVAAIEVEKPVAPFPSPSPPLAAGVPTAKVPLPTGDDVSMTIPAGSASVRSTSYAVPRPTLHRHAIDVTSL